MTAYYRDHIKSLQPPSNPENAHTMTWGTYGPWIYPTSTTHSLTPSLQSSPHKGIKYLLIMDICPTQTPTPQASHAKTFDTHRPWGLHLHPWPSWSAHGRCWYPQRTWRCWRQTRGGSLPLSACTGPALHCRVETHIYSQGNVDTRIGNSFTVNNFL